MITHKSIGYSGRLGNQMFQYAALKSLSLLLGDNEIILPDNTAVKPDGTYDLTNNKWISYRLDLLDCFDLNCKVGNIQTNSDTIVLDGYFQDYRHIQPYKDKILKEFSFKPELYSKCKSIINNYKNTVSVHVRRGDYVNLPHYWVVTPEYIQQALEYFTDKEYTFLIFSDDIAWCKEVFPEGVIFMEGNNQFEDLCLMSLCDHNIIANSSYSWWGAFLNQNPDKIVVSPSQWFTEYKDLSNLYPQQWKRI
jgi:hypothetical protein